MCQLLGMNCNTPTDVAFSFTGFAQRGGRTDHHADGWGIAFFEGLGLRHFVDHQPASESPVAELIRRYPIKSRHVVAHIRKALSRWRTDQFSRHRNGRVHPLECWSECVVRRTNSSAIGRVETQR